MTPQEWAESTDAHAMLLWATRSLAIPLLSPRKLRLIASAIWRVRDDADVDRALAVSGRVSIPDLADAIADGARIPEDRPLIGESEEYAPLMPDARQAALLMAERCHRLFKQKEAQAVRDVLGPLPLRRRSFGNSGWRTPLVMAIAWGCYADRDWPALPILADALEDAGWDDQAVLQHLRSPGPHYRGCWPLDLVLNKE